MKIIKTKKVVITETYKCEVCGRISNYKYDIERCEKNHSAYPSHHPWWFDHKISSALYSECIDALKESDNTVVIIKNRELGEWRHAICPISYIEFWLDSFKSKKEAAKLCCEMGWKIIEQ